MDGIPAALENVLLGFGSEAGKVGVVKEVGRPRHSDAGQLAQAVAERGEVGAFGVGEQRAGKIDVHRRFQYQIGRAHV